MNKENLNIAQIINIININKNSILKVTSIFFLLSFIYSFIIATEYYESSISLYAAGELDDNNILAQYGSLAENFGFSAVPSSNYYIPDIIESRSLKKEIVLKKWNNSKFDTSVNLIEYWGINETSFIGSFFSYFKSFFISEKFQDSNISDLNAAIQNLNQLIHVDEQNSGLIIVKVYMQEPGLASDLANYISKYVVAFINNQQKVYADKSKDFILERMNIAKNDLHQSEEKLTEFRKKNPLVLDTPDLQLIRARLIRNVEVNQQVFITLREQLEIAKIESSKERLLINILDGAEPNPEKSKPQRLLLIIILTLCGLFISIFYQIIEFNFKKINSNSI